MSGYQKHSTGGEGPASLYSDITRKIIAELEAGNVPWVQPWAGSGRGGAAVGMPANASTHRRYSGINILILWNAVIKRGFAHQGWLTFRQALSLGGCVRKGEHGTTVVYADRFVPRTERQRLDAGGDDIRAIPFLKRFTVFNIAQCDGLPDDGTGLETVPDTPQIDPSVRNLIAKSGIDFRVGGDRAYYVPSHDYVQIPPPEAYFEPINWHRTALHELGHASGHPSRLNRDLTGPFGSRKYAAEELVAEMTSAFCCASLGIMPTVRHSDYIANWLEVLREDDKAIFRAASQASKSADYLLGFLKAEDESEAAAAAAAAAARDDLAAA
ncbi:zincin-like metallopeptidase domain-containing protein [Asticcacaulis sp. EMRT-3]|uniref:ArdC family protein n=1 Tax=Asticcacaulis sp. EMRT-3 TaxID=3040349 RepID=UPI0024AF9894|nr:zincin-like metallopeptidase domain-containing protein [Asticcacaulis sp. EMRT-3]MDI7776587.1 zincin-like metallopeptidase domain-containing protein [Asticcacaulis sp. EMRT-3]